VVNEQVLATIIHNHADFIGVSDLQGQMLYLNPAGLKMIGADSELLPALTVQDFYPPHEASKLIHEIVPQILLDGCWTAESRMRKLDGLVIPVEQTITINYEEDEPVSFNIVMRDLSQAKLAEAEQERLQAEIEEIYRRYVRGEWEQFLKKRLAGGIHLEYENPDYQAEDNLKPDSRPPTSFRLPISFRGQDIGMLSLQDLDPHRQWTDDELTLVAAVAEQLALTLENLRLFEETQQQATRERIARQITDKMRVTPDLETIVNTGLAELAKALGVPHTYLKFTTGETK